MSRTELVSLIRGFEPSARRSWRTPNMRSHCVI